MIYMLSIFAVTDLEHIFYSIQIFFCEGVAAKSAKYKY